MVSIDQVTLRVPGRNLFDRLDLKVFQSERLVIMGKSGSGKSMLLKLIAGLERPDRGAVRLFGQDIYKLPPAELNALRKRIGLIFQYGALISSLSVAENLAFAQEELTEKTPAEIGKKVSETLAFVGLPDAGKKMPYELSGGMEKRIAIARALVLEPELLLLDEPTAGLDPINTRLICDLIRRLNEESRATVIMIAHKVEEALKMSTRISVLEEGRIVAQGTPEQIQASTEPIVRQFLACTSCGRSSAASHENGNRI